ncbi:MAG TPA: hypothetical protein VIM31_04215 [Candidatus Microsaccharimonas sp.]|jgi:hypothetical protein
MIEIPSVPNFEYLSQIPVTEDDARTIQALTLQDVTLGGFENPSALANPDNAVKVETQLNKLREHPENYSGYRQENGLIVAYMKTNEWFRGDEAPFAESAFARASLRLKNGSMKPKALGVFGLVVDQSLEKVDQLELLHDLLYRSIGQAATHAAEVINIVIHEHDPVLEMAERLEFRPVGPKGQAVGAPGLLQQRYQLPIRR